MTFENKTFHFRVKGMVQGVGFRYATREKARALGVVGSVRNLADGDVSGLVQGNTESVQVFLQWLRIGPRQAHVTDVTFQETEFQPLTHFVIAA